jgi:hypothetical protein
MFIPPWWVKLDSIMPVPVSQSVTRPVALPATSVLPPAANRTRSTPASRFASSTRGASVAASQRWTEPARLAVARVLPSGE